ncbi:MAG TPA: xanthine dehydrogenase family protein molybdopterin-binding subunit [Afipia sp.]
MGKLNSFIGSAIERVEDLRLLRGKGQYVDDLQRPDLLHMVILRSGVAHGRIRSVDISTAEAMPGVRAVFHAGNLGMAVPKIPMRQEVIPDLQRFEQPVIADGKVRYVGEPMAVVVAETQAMAEDAIEAIEFDIEMLPAVVERHAARSGDTVLFEEIGTNIASVFTAIRGEGEAAFANAPYTRRERMSVHRHTALPMECRGLLAEWDEKAQRLTLNGVVKVPFPNRRILAKHLGLPESSVDLIVTDVGGGFGARGEFYPEDFLVPFCAKTVGRPVKWIEDRRENLLAMNHARDVEFDLELACDRDGKILAMRGHAYSDVGAYMRTVGATASRNVIQTLSGPYRIPDIHVDVAIQVSNKTPSGTYRGPGRFEADFFRERLFDMVAKDLGIDRVEFRRRNLITQAEAPYKLATVQAPVNNASETDSGNYHETFERCLKEINWSEKSKFQGQLIDGRYQGLGIGCYIEGGASGPKENARLALDPDGLISVYVGSSALGQGLETVFSQIAADALEFPMERIRGIFHGSTTLLREGFGTYSSRSVVMGGSAIVDAAQKLLKVICEAAAIKLGCAPNEVEILDGIKVQGPKKKSLPIGELATAGSISVDGSYSSHKRTYAYGAHAAHVAVDARTGHVEILDYVAVEDVGRIINPLTLHGQTLGAIVQGLGGTFLEHLVYDNDGQLLTGSLADYMIPTATDFPNIKVVALESYPSPNNPLGAKGAGEGGIIPVAGVMANAIASALETLGVQPRALPLSPPRLWTLIQESQRSRKL